MKPTHFIISMKAGLTKNSQSKMWRCTTSDGERVNIFSHSDPAKDNSLLFADYLPFMTPMVDGQEITWRELPIPVRMVKNGQWWEIIEVAPIEDTRPDPDQAPDFAVYRGKAYNWANAILNPVLPVVFLDTETTGVEADDEIVSIAVASLEGYTVLNTLIRPTELSKVDRVRKGVSASQIHGITAERLEHAHDFKEVYPAICDALDGKIWVIFNAPFDTRMIEQVCLLHGLVPPVSIGANCAMEMFSAWNGEWSPVYKKIVSKSLEFAAQKFNIHQSDAHDAMADVRTTLEVVKAMADNLYLA